MGISTEVLASLASEVKSRGKGDKPPKRYMPFEMTEWREQVEKPLGKPVTANQAKEIFVHLLAKLATGEWKLETGK